MNSINDFAMDEEFDWDLQIVDGVYDLVPICNHEVVSGLIQQRLNHELDRTIIDSREVDNSLKLQLIREVVVNTHGVSGVNMDRFNPRLLDGVLDLGVICPIIDCANSKECIEL